MPVSTSCRTHGTSQRHRALGPLPWTYTTAGKGPGPLGQRRCPPLVVLTSSRHASELAGRLARTPARGFVHKGDPSGPALSALIDRT